ncbi:MAG: hypothetical protein E6614_28660, partial [Bradyrhizobium sp.]|nr:hypothetical protein [Bradyrhizobium sp.]
RQRSVATALALSALTVNGMTPIAASPLANDNRSAKPTQTGLRAALSWIKPPTGSADPVSAKPAWPVSVARAGLPRSSA